MIWFDCPLCGDRYEVEDVVAGKAILCRSCGEPGKVPTPRRPESAPQPSAEAPTQASPAGRATGAAGDRSFLPPFARKQADAEPWYYGHLEQYAGIALRVGVVGSALQYVLLIGAACSAAQGADKALWILVLLVAGALQILAVIGATALILLAVDVARNQRAMSHAILTQIQRARAAEEGANQQPRPASPSTGVQAP